MNAQMKKAVQVLDRMKGENIRVLDLKKVTTFTDYFIIVTANSETHALALSREVRKTLKSEHGSFPVNPLEQTDRHWVLLDYRDFILHIFTEETRKYYDLEELWFEARTVDPGLSVPRSAPGRVRRKAGVAGD